MTEFMRQRRAILSAAKAQGSIPDYELLNYTVTEGEMIDTGFHPFVGGGAFTVLFDMTTTANPMSGDATNWVFLYALNDGRFCYIGKGSKWVTTIRACWLQGNAIAGDGSSCNAGRHKIAVTHLSNENAINMKGKSISGTAYQARATSGNYYHASPEDTLKIGGPAEDMKGLPPGTIHSVKAYNKVLSDEEINAFLA